MPILKEVVDLFGKPQRNRTWGVQYVMYARPKAEHTMQNHTCVMVLIDEELLGILYR